MNWRIKMLLWGMFCGGLTVGAGYTLTNWQAWVMMFVSGILGTWATWPERVRELEHPKDKQ